MKALCTISQLARGAGVPTSTVRYYERMGLLQPAGRTVGRYRLYGDEALEQLRFIRAAQVTGFTLKDISVLLRFRDATPDVCHDVQGLIKERLADLGKQMADLRHVQRVLHATLRRCRETERSGRCHIFGTLTTTSASHP